MAEIPYFVRFKEVATLVPTDSLFLDDASSDVPKKISYSDFLVGLPSGGSNGTNVLIDCGSFTAPNENVLIDCGTIV